MCNIREALSAIVAEKKKLRQITKRELARRVGCASGFMSEMLNGDKRISTEMLEKICAALGVKLSDLENWNSELAEIRFTAANHGEAASPELIRAQRKLSRLYKANRAVFDAAVAVIESGLKGTVRGAAEDTGKKAAS